MRKLFAVAMIVVAFCAIGMAQDLPKAEVFGGYSYYRLDIHEAKDAGDLNKSGLNLNGWNGALTGYFNNNFGIVADISGNYGSPTVTGAGLTGKLDTKVHNYLFGPQFAYRTERGTVFARALFGASNVRIKTAGVDLVKDTSFAWGLGGGLDLNVNKNFGVRVAQFDWINSKFNGIGSTSNDRQNNIRYSAGVVLHF